jgi:hypothetical protein
VPCSGQDGHPRYKNGEATDQQFAPDELLYRRVKKEFVQGRQVLPSALAFPRQSFNRQKYSETEDVLHQDCCGGENRAGLGVAECAVADLPSPLTADDGRVFHFCAVHVPGDCCFAHSELHCLLNDQPIDEPNKKIRERFRVSLAQRLRIRIEATA